MNERGETSGEQGNGRGNPWEAKAGSASQVDWGDLLALSQTSPSAALRSAERRDALQAALAQLPPAYRTVIVLRILEGQSVADTATAMQRSPGAVSVLLNKAVKRLARVIGAQPGDDSFLSVR